MTGLGRVRALFDEALKIPSGEREAFVRDKAAGDAALVSDVLGMLLQHMRAGTTATNPDAWVPKKPSKGADRPAIPGRLGRYQIIREIGEGGMGTVYEAKQDDTGLIVALKVIRAGHFSPAALERFKREWRGMARLQHPAIAQIHEAGVIDSDGEAPIPYFAMEFVRGSTLAMYARKKCLGFRARMELMAKVCDGVHHAHQRNIIHRDLKPANIMVDESGQPKILDFGVARILDDDPKQDAVRTWAGFVPGTPDYMSPEQWAGDSNAMTTTSDVYTLGVIAYELLSGRRPLRLWDKPRDVAIDMIRYLEPKRLASYDRRRGALARWLARPWRFDPRETLHGDLDTIIHKAMEKDPERRYPSADAMGADIGRYLSSEPITAHPASMWEILWKFGIRHKGLVGGLATAFAILIAGLGVSLYAFAQAKKRAEEVQQVAEFQGNMLAGIDPTIAGLRLFDDIAARYDARLIKDRVHEQERAARVEGLKDALSRVNPTDTAAAMVDRVLLSPASDAIDRQFKEQPVVEARLRQVLADRYRELGLYEAALPLQKSALETRLLVLGEGHQETLVSMSSMGVLLHARGQLVEAETYLREAARALRYAVGEEHQNSVVSIHNLGSLLKDRGEFPEAESCYREALENSKRLLGESHPHTLAILGGLGNLLHGQGRFDEAETCLREALDTSRQVLGQDHPDTLAHINNLGFLLAMCGRLGQAEVYFDEALEGRRRALGEEHPDTLNSINNMGQLLKTQGKLAEAEPYLREAMEKRRRVLGAEHPNTLGSINNFGLLLQDQGKLNEAEPYVREALETLERVLGRDHFSTLGSINNMGMLLHSQGNLEGAEPYLREALERSRTMQGEEHPDTLQSINNLVRLFQEQRRFSDAEPYAREALEKCPRVLGETHADTINAISNMGLLLQAQGKLAEAEPYLRDVLEKRRQALGEDHMLTLGAMARLGVLLQAQGRLDNADVLLREALNRCRHMRGERHPTTLLAISCVGSLLRDQGRPVEAEGILLAAIAIADAELPARHQARIGLIRSLTTLYESWNRIDPGKGYDLKAAEWRAKLAELDTEVKPASSDG